MKNITPKQLKEIENDAENEFELSEIFENLSIQKSELTKEEILKIERAFQKGRKKLYFDYLDKGYSDLEFIECFEVTEPELKIFAKDYENYLTKKEKKLIKKEKGLSNLISSPELIGSANICASFRVTGSKPYFDIISENVEKMVSNIINGDRKDLITVLTAQTLQLQTINNQVASIGKKETTINDFEKLAQMQLKIMAETRKNIIAIDSIANPKKSTFVKEATQNNFIQENSEKKSLPQNEKQMEEIEVIPLEEKNNEHTL